MKNKDTRECGMFANKTVWHRSKGEAGVNVLGMIGDSWEQMEHMRTIRTEGGRGAGLKQRLHMWQTEFNRPRTKTKSNQSKDQRIKDFDA